MALNTNVKCRSSCPSVGVQRTMVNLNRSESKKPYSQIFRAQVVRKRRQMLEWGRWRSKRCRRSPYPYTHIGKCTPDRISFPTRSVSVRFQRLIWFRQTVPSLQRIHTIWGLYDEDETYGTNSFMDFQPIDLSAIAFIEQLYVSLARIPDVVDNNINA